MVDEGVLHELGAGKRQGQQDMAGHPPLLYPPASSTTVDKHDASPTATPLGYRCLIGA